MRLPASMLAYSSKTFPAGDYLHEPKLDGFRALVSTVSGLRVTSRRGWRMGVVAKRGFSIYRPGRCSSWVKVKNSDYSRRDAEREAVSFQRISSGRSVLSAPATR